MDQFVPMMQEKHPEKPHACHKLQVQVDDATSNLGSQSTERTVSILWDTELQGPSIGVTQ